MPTPNPAPSFRFWLGTHHASWLSTASVPLFVSSRTLAPRKSFPEATVPYAIDSAGYTELSLYGEWRTSPAEYVRLLRRYRDEMGPMAWASSQDYMNEPDVLAKTGMTVQQHQALTIERFLELRTLDADLPIVPVLQGWTAPSYRRHLDAYLAAGVDLTREPLVGVGSICRRTGSVGISLLLEDLTHQGIRVHAFGAKSAGLRLLPAPGIASADSLAWSYGGRYERGCSAGHKTEANCIHEAMRWRERYLDGLPWAAPDTSGAVA
ncbi:hypothetical protein [Kitasatospora sp. MBT66]|uniref:deazapurine DNA modification protein DpdA family protein n=1 Tax=Kitasatospora sp. MBT66 TaxID=1444769 RepID=UPI0005B8D730|nr:hypothetical protein [Kitasatospora sp. MBT66]